MMIAENEASGKCKISKIGITDETLTGRAGLFFISRYVKQINICQILAEKFAYIRKSAKGIPLVSIFSQIITFFLNGENFNLVHFDRLKEDSSYSHVIETPKKQILSSHAAKRFFTSFSISQGLQLRKILQLLFIWQLKKEKPRRIILGLDTMVMDNNDAHKREGVDPTYKKVKGFQPLHLYWGRFIIDTIFRNGKAHSNHGNNVRRVVTNAVNLIRKNYSQSVPIILLADAGFYDQQLFELCSSLEIGFIVGGKMYEDIKETVAKMPDSAFFEYKKPKKTWFILDFDDRRASWEQSWRCIYMKPISDEVGQVLLDFVRPESLLYTNLGMDNTVTQTILKNHNANSISPEAIVLAYHNRARDELANRAFKDFGTEKMPFKTFAANSVFYYLMAISFFLFESFKYDMKSEVIPLTWYPQTFRRRFIDAAGKVISTGRCLTLKLTRNFHSCFNITELWEKLLQPDFPPLVYS